MVQALPYYTVAFVFGYLCGSIPFGVLLTRLVGGPDLRTVGSGNIGATNVLRTGRRGLAAATLIGDMLKGTIAVLVARHVLGHDFALVAGVGAFLGHLFPVWLGFRGGKGVATYIGVLLGIAWLAAIVFCAIWLAVAALTRYSSLAALIAAAVTPVLLWWRGDTTEALVFLLLSAVLWIKHRGNIGRLLSGTEGKIGARSPTASTS
jgi:acyl phosphate:glycerol-3-phosphate acyltransferase